MIDNIVRLDIMFLKFKNMRTMIFK